MKSRETADLVTKSWMIQVSSRLQNVFDDNITYKVSCGVLEAADTSKSRFYVFLPNSMLGEVK